MGPLTKRTFWQNVPVDETYLLTKRTVDETYFLTKRTSWRNVLFDKTYRWQNVPFDKTKFDETAVDRMKFDKTNQTPSKVLQISTFFLSHLSISRSKRSKKSGKSDTASLDDKERMKIAARLKDPKELKAANENLKSQIQHRKNLSTSSSHQK